MRCITFHLGKGRYALPLKDLVEVLPLLPMREVPHAPDFISGVIDYRGQIVPVLDLCQLALERACEERMSTRLIVLRLQAGNTPARLLALMVERAISEVKLDPATLAPPPVRIDTTPYLKGLASTSDGLLQLVDAALILPEEAAALLYSDGPLQP